MIKGIVSDEDIENGLQTSPTNTANGINKISYLFLQFWKRKETDSFMKVTRRLINDGCEEWKKAETILIKKETRKDTIK